MAQEWPLMMNRLSFIEKTLREIKEQGLLTAMPETIDVQDSKFMVSQLLAATSLNRAEISNL